MTIYTCFDQPSKDDTCSQLREKHPHGRDQYELCAQTEKFKISFIEKLEELNERSRISGGVCTTSAVVYVGDSIVLGLGVPTGSLTARVLTVSFVMPQ